MKEETGRYLFFCSASSPARSEPIGCRREADVAASVKRTEASPEIDFRVTHDWAGDVCHREVSGRIQFRTSFRSSAPKAGCLLSYVVLPSRLTGRLFLESYTLGRLPPCLRSQCDPHYFPCAASRHFLYTDSGASKHNRYLLRLLYIHSTTASNGTSCPDAQQWTGASSGGS